MVTAPQKGRSGGHADGSGKKRIGELLIEEGLITSEALKEALAVQGKEGGKTVEILISLGHLTSRDFVNFLAKQEGVASIDLGHYEIAPDIIGLVPKDLAVKHEVIPIDKLGKLLTVGMTCPLDSATIEHISEATGLRVKAMLCSPGDVRAALRRYYRVGEEEAEFKLDETRAGAAPARPEPDSATDLIPSLQLASAVRLMRQIDSLPGMPSTVQRVQALLENPESSVKEVAEVINMDPSIAAKILSVANSAAYGFPNRVDTVQLAVTLLGVRETYSVVLSCAVVDLFDKSKLFDYAAFWRDSTFCALAAQAIAKTSSQPQKTGVFSAGLLHDLGRVALAEVVPERYARVNADLVGADLIAAEEEVFGVAHPEAGYELACHWGLPEDIAEAIRFHHTPQHAAKGKAMVAMVAIANIMAEVYRPGSDEAQEPNFDECRDSLECLGIDEASMKELFGALPPPQEYESLWQSE